MILFLFLFLQRLAVTLAQERFQLISGRVDRVLVWDPVKSSCPVSGYTIILDGLVVGSSLTEKYKFSIMIPGKYVFTVISNSPCGNSAPSKPLMFEIFK